MYGHSESEHKSEHSRELMNESELDVSDDEKDQSHERKCYVVVPQTPG